MAVFALDRGNLTIMIMFMTKPKTIEIKFKIIITCLEFHPDQSCADISCSTSYCVSVLLYPFCSTRSIQCISRSVRWIPGMSFVQTWRVHNRRVFGTGK